MNISQLDRSINKKVVDKKAFVLRSAPSGIKRIDEITEKSQVIIGWSRLGKYIHERLSRDRIKDLLIKHYPHYDENAYSLGQAAGYLVRFLNEMDMGDYVLVPISRAFYLGQIVGDPIYLQDKVFEDTAIRRNVEWLNAGRPILREICSAGLISRMKYQGTCVSASKFVTDIEKALKHAENGTKPNFKSELNEALKQITEDYLVNKSSNLSPSKFESLIQQVMIGLGADKAIKPARNKYKNSIADVDVEAVFEHLGITIYIQAKHHKNETDVHSVKQVMEALRIDNVNGDAPVQGWVISSGSFSQEAEKLANESGIRMINGSDLSDIIVSIGLDVFENKDG